MRIGRIVTSTILLAAIILCSFSAAQAERLVLPSQLVKIEEEAFYGNSSIEEVIIPEKATEIGDRAFANCSMLGSVTIPPNIRTIGENIFEGCAADLLVRTTPNSEALHYARAFQFDYHANTHYRALLIGQSYPDREDLSLEGSCNDVVALTHCLERFTDTKYDTMVRLNLTADEILCAIDESFGNASSEDVSLFYFSGHGFYSQNATEKGALLGADGTDYVTADQLRAALDDVPGRRIVIIDACYSGCFISLNRQTMKLQSTTSTGKQQYTNEDFASSFISAFSRKNRSSNLVGDHYFVITAAAADEESYEDSIQGTTMGLFTAALCNGCGYDIANSSTAELLADINMNQVLTFNEILKYTRKNLLVDGQHVQGYPSECLWFGVFRE